MKLSFELADAATALLSGVALLTSLAASPTLAGGGAGGTGAAGTGGTGGVDSATGNGTAGRGNGQWCVRMVPVSESTSSFIELARRRAVSPRRRPKRSICKIRADCDSEAARSQRDCASRQGRRWHRGLRLWLVAKRERAGRPNQFGASWPYSRSSLNSLFSTSVVRAPAEPLLNRWMSRTKVGTETQAADRSSAASAASFLRRTKRPAKTSSIASQSASARNRSRQSVPWRRCAASYSRSIADKWEHGAKSTPGISGHRSVARRRRL